MNELDRWALINNNMVVNVICCGDPEFIKSLEPDYQHIELLDTPEEQNVACTGWGWDPETNTFIEPPPPSPPPIVEVWIIPSLMFRNRFTFQEKVNITNAAKTDIVVQVFSEDLNANPTVNLQGEETIYAVNYLADTDVIQQDRVSVLLAPAYQQGGQWVDPPTE
jgi:hypothetical protein